MSAFHKSLVQWVLAVLCASCLTGGSTTSASECASKEATSGFGAWRELGLKLSSSNSIRKITQARYNLAGIESWRFQVVDRTKQNTAWTIVVRDETSRPVAVLRPDQVTGSGASFRNIKIWTGRISASSVTFELLGVEAGMGDINIAGALAYPKASDDVLLFSIKGADPTWVDPYEAGGDRIRRSADSTAMLLTGGTNADGNFESWTCSGVLLEGGLLLTNWHCGGAPWLERKLYWNEEVRSNCILDFRWDGGHSPSQFSCGSVLLSDESLDFALIKLEPLRGGASLETAPPPAEASVNEPAADIYVVHHARSSTKLLSRNCRTANVDSQTAFFRHDCDTDPGASGAPVFDALTNKIVGLHHSGFVRDKNCLVIGKYNEAVKISAIMKKICDTSTTHVKKVCE